MNTVAQKYFVSYARSDGEFALKLAKDLRDAGANVWLDQLDILGGQRWDEAVERALHECEGMVLVLSPASVGSNNVMDEASYAIGHGKVLVPVLHKACEIPYRIARFHHIDFTSNYKAGLTDLRRALRIPLSGAPLKDNGSPVGQSEAGSIASQTGEDPGDRPTPPWWAWCSRHRGILTVIAVLVSSAVLLLIVQRPADNPPNDCATWQAKLDEKRRIQHEARRRLEQIARSPSKEPEEVRRLERDVQNLEKEIGMLEADIGQRCAP